jgi:hypothetical protein
LFYKTGLKGFASDKRSSLFNRPLEEAKKMIKNDFFKYGGVFKKLTTDTAGKNEYLVKKYIFTFIKIY